MVTGRILQQISTYLEAQVVCLVHQKLNFFAAFKNLLNVVDHDVLDLINLKRHGPI